MNSIVSSDKKSRCALQRLRSAYRSALASARRSDLLLISSCVLLAAGVAIAQVPPPPGTESIAVDNFTGGGDSELVGAAEGLGDMIQGDAIGLLADDGPFSDCDVIFVGWGKLRAQIQAEIDLQQTEYFDPATRLRPGQLIDPTMMLSGHSEFAGGVTHYKVELRRHPSGELISSMEGSASEDDYIGSMPARIARKLLE